MKVVSAVASLHLAASMAPKHSWDYLANMTFFHACNESGLYSEEALDVITKFPLVTVEKGQGFNDGSGRMAEDKIIEQLAAVKARDSSIATVFYMNSVLDWYFYHMHEEYLQHEDWWLRRSDNGEPFYTSGDKTFNPPKEGMLVFDHGKKAVRDFWRDTCLAVVQTGHVDGCFSDSSQVGTHGTKNVLNSTDNATFEQGKVATMTTVTADFGGQAGQPFAGSTGVLIGKKSYQEGINAYQIEFFEPKQALIQELQAGAAKGWLVQAHVGVDNEVTTCGCECMNDVVAAFLVGAGDYSYFGSGKWITKSLDEVTRQWCPELFERPLGRPLSDAVLSAGRYERHFESGTWVEFATSTNKGVIHWALTPSPSPPPADACQDKDFLSETGIRKHDITPDSWSSHLTDSAAECCQACWGVEECAAWTWYTDGTKECHFHDDFSGKWHSAGLARTSQEIRPMQAVLSVV